ncbi:MAG TPA: hypothetical protein VHC90_07945, partial [Bryobacteraceae bacterium]|nr:hypothetical protein [Bryobacteraceae bacterium]
MSKPLFMTSIALLGLILTSRSQSQTAALVPVRTIITVEAARDHDTSIPPLTRDDVMAYEQKQSLRVAELKPFAPPNAGLDLYVLVDDASSSSLGSQLDDLRNFIKAQPETTNIGLGYMHNGT